MNLALVALSKLQLHVEAVGLFGLFYAILFSYYFIYQGVIFLQNNVLACNGNPRILFITLFRL